MARYLIHKDNPDKYQYEPTDVITNSKDKFFSFLKDLSSDCLQEFHDLQAVKLGLLTPEQFMEKYRGEFSAMPFYHKLNIYSKLCKGDL